MYFAPESSIQGEIETVCCAEHCLYDSSMHSMGLKYASYSTMAMQLMEMEMYPNIDRAIP